LLPPIGSMCEAGDQRTSEQEGATQRKNPDPL
jgi:hypothetical protein